MTSHGPGANSIAPGVVNGRCSLWWAQNKLTLQQAAGTASTGPSGTGGQAPGAEGVWAAGLSLAPSGEGGSVHVSRTTTLASLPRSSRWRGPWGFDAASILLLVNSLAGSTSDSHDTLRSKPRLEPATWSKGTGLKVWVCGMAG